MRVAKRFCAGMVRLILTAVILAATVGQAEIVTVFTYQGRLSDGSSSADGTFDFIFDLYPGMTGGSSAHTMATNNVTVTDGYFEVYLDFGSNVFTGKFWAVEIRVRPSGGGTYETLSPRQPILPTPYAMCAASVERDGINAAALQDNAVLSRAIKDGEVGMADMAENSVSSNQIVNGTITATDIDGGLYSKKSQLYVRTATNTVPGNSAQIATAYCDDENDLPISWYAESAWADGLSICSIKLLDWSDETKRAGVSVDVVNSYSLPDTMIIGIVCIRVD